MQTRWCTTRTPAPACSRAFCSEWPIASTRPAKLGLDVVYTTQASVAQPDFTAECLNARNAGATAEA